MRSCVALLEGQTQSDVDFRESKIVTEAEEMLHFPESDIGLMSGFRRGVREVFHLLGRYVPLICS